MEMRFGGIAIPGQIAKKPVGVSAIRRHDVAAAEGCFQRDQPGGFKVAGDDVHPRALIGGDQFFIIEGIAHGDIRGAGGFAFALFHIAGVVGVGKTMNGDRDVRTLHGE